MHLASEVPPIPDAIFYLIVVFFLDLWSPKAKAPPIMQLINVLAPTARIKENCAYPASPIMWQAHEFCQVGHQTARVVAEVVADVNHVRKKAL